MGFTRYASLESTEVLGIKGSSEKVHTASLDRFSDFEDYRTQDGFLYVRLKAQSSRINRNNDGWPSVELAGGPDAWKKYTKGKTSNITVHAHEGPQYGFSTFLNKPVFVDHNNTDPSKAKGVIVDAKLHIEDTRTSAHDTYYSARDVDPEHLPPTWIELLVEVDAKSFPRLAKEIVEGGRNPAKGIDGWSMGCNVEKTKCSICSNVASEPEEFCKHVKLKGAHFDSRDSSGRRVSKRAYENCYGIQYFEISAVFDPADETALTRSIKEGSKRSDVLPRTPEEWHTFNPDEQVERGFGQCPRCRQQAVNLGGHCQNCGYRIGQDGAEYSSPSGPTNIEHSDWNPDSLTPHWGNARHSKTGESWWRFADNPKPQGDSLTAPDHVNTLRSDDVCEVCGSEMDGPTCKLCQWSKPPDGFDNPDLTKLHPEIEAERRGQPQEEDPIAKEEGSPLTSEIGPAQDKATNTLSSTQIKNDMSGWKLSVHPKVAGRINTTERPIRPQGPVSGEPTETVLSDQQSPILTRTASDMIAAAQKENEMKVADAASGAPAAADPQGPGGQPGVRGDVEGVGGWIQDSNEEASKPTGRHGEGGATVDVEAIGGTGVEDVEADEHDHVDHGDEHTKTTDDSGPTKTWGQGTGVEHQEDAVSREPFPASDEGVKKSAERTAYDSDPFPHDDGGLAGGGAVSGNKPVAETFGERVDVLDPVATPENNSGPTKTWSGTDGNKINRQQEPVTKDTLEGEDRINLHSSKHFFTAFKLADTEVDLGLIGREDKYNRVAELLELSPAEIDAEARVVARVKTSGIRRQATKQGGVGRLPSMKPTPKEAAAAPVEPSDESLFW